MTVSEELKNKAIKLGLCGEWTDNWQNPNLHELVEMYISGIDFCILNNYPSNEYIKDNFGKTAEEHGVYTDSEIDIQNPDVAIVNGKTTGKIVLTGFVSRDIYVRHNSEVLIEINDMAKAFIRVFDKAKVTVKNNSTNRIFVYKYGGTIEIYGDILIRQRSMSDL